LEGRRVRLRPGTPKSEGRIWPRIAFDKGGRYLGYPPKSGFVTFPECPRNRVRYRRSIEVTAS
jgi:hypothetical protein